MIKKKEGKKNSLSPRHSTSSAPVRNLLREVRRREGISQVQLAAKVGLTRQAIYAIEANQYLPSTQIALQLSQALKCRVEDLFSFFNAEEIIEAEFIGNAKPQEEPMRVKLSEVGSRILARPMTDLGDVLNFVIPADGVLLENPKNTSGPKGKRVQVKLLDSRESLKTGILIAGCDPAMFLAGEHVRKLSAVAGVTNWTMGSANAIRALQRGEVHMAGVHIVDGKSGQSNVPYLKRHVRRKEFVGVHFASWVQGLLVRHEDSKRIRGLSDLAKPGLRLVNREVGSGARLLLDALLQEAGLVGKKLKGYEYKVRSHLDVARLIRDGMADVGIGVEAAARSCGLSFIPLRQEQYDLIMREEFLKSHPMIQQFWDAVVSQPFRREIEALGGYDLANVGQTLNW